MPLRSAFLLLSLMLLSACSVPQASPGPSQAASAQPSAIQTALPASPTFLLPQVASETPVPSTVQASAVPVVAVTPTISPTSSPVFQVCSPLASDSREDLYQIVSAPYAPPPPGKEERHHGVDFSFYQHKGLESILGVVVQAALPGRVAASIIDRFPYGNVVILETPGEILPPDVSSKLGLAPGESIYALYAHLQEAPRVFLGDEVAACQPLGQVGKSGNAGVAHLHLEMRLGPSDQVFTSIAYYDALATEEEKANYTLWRTSWVFRHFDPMTILAP